MTNHNPTLINRLGLIEILLNSQDHINEILDRVLSDEGGNVVIGRHRKDFESYEQYIYNISTDLHNRFGGTWLRLTPSNTIDLYTSLGCYN